MFQPHKDLTYSFAWRYDCIVLRYLLLWSLEQHLNLTARPVAVAAVAVVRNTGSRSFILSSSSPPLPLLCTQNTNCAKLDTIIGSSTHRHLHSSIHKTIIVEFTAVPGKREQMLSTNPTRVRRPSTNAPARPAASPYLQDLAATRRVNPSALAWSLQRSTVQDCGR